GNAANCSAESTTHTLECNYNNTAARPVSLDATTAGNRIQLTSDFTLAANTNLQTIFSWTTVAVAQNYMFHCQLMYSQATAAVSDTFGIQVATNAPTNLSASGEVFTAAGTVTSGVLTNLTTTTATNIVTFTPSAITTVFRALLDGSFELPA